MRENTTRQGWLSPWWPQPAPERQLAEPLPAVCDDVVPAILLLAAAQVQHQPLLAHQLDLQNTKRVGLVVAEAGA